MAKIMTLLGIVALLASSYIITGLGLVDRRSFVIGVAITLPLALSFLYSGFIAFRDERRQRLSLEQATRAITRAADGRSKRLPFGVDTSGTFETVLFPDEGPALSTWAMGADTTKEESPCQVYNPDRKERSNEGSR